MSRRLAHFVLFAFLAGTGVASAQTGVSQSAARANTATLQNAAVANGNGTSLIINGMALAVLTVNCNGCNGAGTTINFEVSEDQTNFVPRYAVQSGQLTAGSLPSTSAAGVTVWEVPVGGFVLLRARISNYINGTVTVTGHAVPIGATPSVTAAAIVNQAAQSTLSTGGLFGRTTWRLPPLFASNSNPPDPCQGPNTWSVAISQTTNTLVLAGVAGKRIYLCQYTVVGADAEQLSWVEGTGSTCGTSTTAVVGGTTAAAGMSFAANGGVNADDGPSWVAVTAVLGNSLCLLQSGSGRVAGSLKYAIPLNQ